MVMARINKLTTACPAACLGEALRRRKPWRRRDYWLLTAILSLLSYPALAYDFAGGTGEPNDPYQIATAEQLVSIGSDPNLLRSHFVLVNDIDLDPNLPGGRVFDRALIAPDPHLLEEWFRGRFDGNGFAVQNLNISGEDDLGLFGGLHTEALVLGLAVVNAHITGTHFIGIIAGRNYGRLSNCHGTGIVTGDHNVGGLVGYNAGGELFDCSTIATVSGFSGVGCLVGLNCNRISNCFSTGSVSGKGAVGGLLGAAIAKSNVADCYSSASVSGELHVGGLVGHHWHGMLANCHSTGTVSGTKHVGGLVGQNFDGGHVSRCYSTGMVTGVGDVGGLVGEHWGDSVSNCYSKAAVTGDWNVGGLVGDNWANLIQCYSMGTVSGRLRVGGLVGRNDDGTVADCYSVGAVSGNSNRNYHLGGLFGKGGEKATNSFWDVKTSGRLESEGGVGLSTTEMQDVDTYLLAGWQFSDVNEYGAVWRMPPVPSYPIHAWTPYSGGEGTKNSPYRLGTVDDLLALSEAEAHWDRHFILISDIDLKDYVFDRALIAPDINDALGYPNYYQGTPFSGEFDGKGHSIKNLRINGRCCLGLFGMLSFDACVHHLQVTDVNVVGGGACIGGLAGYNYGRVLSCHCTGSVLGYYQLFFRRCDNRLATAIVPMRGPDAVGSTYVGGLIGYNQYGAVIDCHSSVTVTGYAHIGGLVGQNSNGTLAYNSSVSRVHGHNGLGGLIGYAAGEVFQCYSQAEISGNGHGHGGLVGRNRGPISDCYSLGVVKGCTAAGGLVGENERGIITQCFSASETSGNRFVGGLTGSNSAQTIGSFWDTQLSQLLISTGGQGLTTTEMQTSQPYLEAGWDFDSVWFISEGSYPELQWNEVESMVDYWLTWQPVDPVGRR